MGNLRAPLEILGEIERLLKTIPHEVPPAEPTSRIKALIATVNQLEQPKNARPAKCPADYVQLWRNIGSTRPSELPNRAIRYLSWETDVAVSPAFQAVALTPERVSARSLQGFVRSVHRRWNSIVGTSSLGNVVVAITTYTGKNALIEKWKMGLQCVLHRDAPLNLARHVVTESTTWENTASLWRLEPDTEFGNAVLEHCLKFAASGTSHESERFYNEVVRRILPSRYWSPNSFKMAVQQSLLASPRLSQQYSELLMNFALSDPRLLDPRLPANANNWIGISDAARDLLIQWLSAEDIQLFFDHVLPARSDPHGRKPFWLKYKDKVKRSRPLLSYLDETRWQANAVTKGKRNFGRMDYNCDTSAFLLDFGTVMVVEFSKVGNAVYIYPHRDIRRLTDSFWSSARFSLHELKQPENCIDRITHNPHWQRKMRTLLAQYGIHPGG